MAMLGIGERCIRHVRSKGSLYFKHLRHYPTNPKTLGEHLCRKRIDLSLSLTQLAQVLGIGVCASTIAKWERNQNYPAPAYRIRIVEFLGYDPEAASPTGGS
jgi:DNA-binding transcriptional regulator YiaG